MDMKVNGGSSHHRWLSTAKACRAAVDADLESFDRLPVAQAAQMRAEVRRASRRYRYAVGVADVQGPAWAAAWLSILGMAIALLATSSGVSSIWLVLDGVLFVVGLLVMVVVLYFSIDQLGRLIIGRGSAYAELVIFLALAVAPLMLIPAKGAPGSHLPRSLFMGWGAGWMALLVGLVINALGVTAWAKWRVGQRCRPYDELALATMWLAGDMEMHKSDWHSRSTVRQWCAELEGLANSAEYSLAIPRRLPYRVRGARRKTKAEALRVAEVFRGHQVAIAAAYGTAHIDRVVASLTAAMQALLVGDRTLLLANAPEHVPFSNRLKRGAARVWPSVVLAAAGWWLPMLPLPGMAEAGIYVRTVLWVSAVGLLVSPQASREIGGVLGKALPTK
ncbi:hypothetical protein [Streptomyces sp. KR55]|uniref:hypothetical protein n=1 Tax=Streptomyces sp. KR55 TaxID=3457425 RepID=UPI003FD05BF6